MNINQLIYIDVSCWSKPGITKAVYALWFVTHLVSLAFALFYNYSSGGILYSTRLYNILTLIYIIFKSYITNCGQIKSRWETDPNDRIVLKYYDNCIISYLLSLTGELVFIQIDLCDIPPMKDLLLNWSTVVLLIILLICLNATLWSNSSLTRRTVAASLFVSELIFTILSLQEYAEKYRYWFFLANPVLVGAIATGLKYKIKCFQDPSYNTLKENGMLYIV